MDSFSLFSAFRERQVVGDLIVVASLLEKIPNFGHLTRTCEIFGVKELVFPTKKILEDESYQAVSVTAEKHIPIVEVKE
jgi:tRNA guanosine-2'-O-methyltransferase